MQPPRPVTLIILDGWGIAPPGPGNAITLAPTPFMDSLYQTYSHTELLCFGEAVGLPEGQMGNSEVGHLNLGAGRVVYQDITRINLAIREDGLASNQVLANAYEKVKQSGGTLHFLGLLSHGGVHSLMDHLYALIELAERQQVPRCAVHAFLDGRDTPPDSGAGYVQELLDYLKKHPGTRLASLGGRYWGMDRDKRWDRVQKAWDAMIHGKGPTTCEPVSYLKECYAREEFDEFVTPTLVLEDPQAAPLVIRDGDAVVFFNFRADRARELTWAFNQPDFDGFDVSDRPRLAAYVCMTQYDEKLEVPVAFPPEHPKNTLAEVLSKRGLKQLHIAETEKYAHVTFFFNGGEETPFPGEDRVLVPSPKVATYDLKPEMSAPEVTDRVLERIATGDYDFIVINYANGDMVGHTGVLEAAMKAVETVDGCLARLVPAVLEAGGKVALTADHGNAEQMIDPATGGPYTAHTVDKPVPFIFIDPDRRGVSLRRGALCDVAPTVLEMMGIEPPPEMTGRSLVLTPDGKA